MSNKYREQRGLQKKNQEIHDPLTTLLIQSGVRLYEKCRGGNQNRQLTQHHCLFFFLLYFFSIELHFVFGTFYFLLLSVYCFCFVFIFVLM